MSERHDLTLREVRALYDLPLFELVDRARAGSPRQSPARLGAALHAAQREDRRLPGGLRVLPAVEPLRHARSPAEKMLDVDDVLAAARERASSARPASAWAPPGAR